MRRAIAIVLVTVIGIAGGAVLTLWLHGGAVVPRAEPRVPGLAAVATTTEPPTVFLAWIPRGIPAGYADRVRRRPGIEQVTVVAEGIAWLSRSWSAAGELVDHPPGPYRIPLDVAAVPERGFAALLPAPDRAIVTSVASGEGILGATAARLRGLGPGAVLRIGSERIRVAGVLPDERVGAAELLVSRRTGREIGVVNERYLLIRTAPDAGFTSDGLQARLRPTLPVSLGVNRAIQVRAPGETPFLRVGDAVMPLVLVKALFGEFAARPRPGVPGALIVDPAWARANIATVRIPLLGPVTCHRGILDQLRQAMRAVADAGGDVRTFDGCFVPRFIDSDPRNMLSYHSWGIAFDLNAGSNVRGQAPRQPPMLVEALEEAGFQWGGAWIVPDGNHFEYRRAAIE